MSNNPQIIEQQFEEIRNLIILHRTRVLQNNCAARNCTNWRGFNCADSICTNSPTMVAEYHRQLIPKEVMQKSLDEFCAFLFENQQKRPKQ